jgi:TPR repeat protein
MDIGELRRRADSGSVVAQSVLGICYLEGIEVEEIEIARMYSRGIGGPADPDLARKWYSAATSQERDVDDCDEMREAKAYLSAGS